eukprot:gnl/MRDRNA2_/MRDRNA2_105182_c0_seq1.p1 gnl/MRDRNA2_/MRDRNA2_105182_c0~~gnl/MRDRNA2_/MRDRNA2_105182_c0_seq1.p1  ORF type:complete len:794 (-),score=133.28 gnl/MRDRNA2_/MRDRNA2_105182_c0_seq1:220-2601(-)
MGRANKSFKKSKSTLPKVSHGSWDAELAAKKKRDEEEERKRKLRNVAIYRLVFHELRSIRTLDDNRATRLSIKILFNDVRQSVRKALHALKEEEARAQQSNGEIEHGRMSQTFMNGNKWLDMTQGVDERGFTLSLGHVSEHVGLPEDEYKIGISYLYQRMLDKAHPERLKIGTDRLANEASNKKLLKPEFIENLGKVSEWLNKEDLPLQYKPKGHGSQQFKAAAKLAILLNQFDPKKAWKACARCAPQVEEEQAATKVEGRLSLMGMVSAKRFLRSRKAPSIDQVKSRLNSLWEAMGIEDSDEEAPAEADVNSVEEAPDEDPATEEQPTFPKFKSLSGALNSFRKLGQKVKAGSEEPEMTGVQEAVIVDEEPRRVKKVVSKNRGEDMRKLEELKWQQFYADMEEKRRIWQEARNRKLARQEQMRARQVGRSQGLLTTSRMQGFSLDQQIANSKKCREKLSLRLDELNGEEVASVLENLGLHELHSQVCIPAGTDDSCKVDPAQLMDFLFSTNSGLPKAGMTNEINKLCAWVEENSGAAKEVTSYSSSKVNQNMRLGSSAGNAMNTSARPFNPMATGSNRNNLKELSSQNDIAGWTPGLPPGQTRRLIRCSESEDLPWSMSMNSRGSSSRMSPRERSTPTSPPSYTEDPHSTRSCKPSVWSSHRLSTEVPVRTAPTSPEDPNLIRSSKANAWNLQRVSLQVADLNEGFNNVHTARDAFSQQNSSRGHFGFSPSTAAETQGNFTAAETQGNSSRELILKSNDPKNDRSLSKAVKAKPIGAWVWRVRKGDFEMVPI